MITNQANGMFRGTVIALMAVLLPVLGATARAATDVKEIRRPLRRGIRSGHSTRLRP